MAGVFISYRREDSAAYAGRLYDHLSARFGAERVFMDIDTIRPGDDFVQVISDKVAACDVLIVVNGKRWLTTPDSRGRRRLEDRNDASMLAPYSTPLILVGASIFWMLRQRTA